MTRGEENHIDDPRNCIAILLTSPDGTLILQHRDDKSDIEYPGHWALIAGCSHVGETLLAAIRRELDEELRQHDLSKVSFGPTKYLFCEHRPDRPWREYVFQIELLTGADNLVILEGQGVSAFTIRDALSLPNLAPHHARYIRQWASNYNVDQSSNFADSAQSSQKERPVQTIDDYLLITDLAHHKDYALAESGLGFVVVNGPSVTASISPKFGAEYIALLQFDPDAPRGHHYHRRKIEYMTVLKGRLHCVFKLADQPAESRAITLESGQMVRILPGCIHTYTAEGDVVMALEFSPQALELDDVIAVES